MARASMANLIKELRAMTQAQSTDYTVESVSWFTDDQLQAELDKLRTTWVGLLLDYIPTRKLNGYEYKQYRIPEQVGVWIEDSTGSDNGWYLYDNTGATVTATYTTNFQARLITFAVDTTGQSYWLECRSYDLNKAAASVWRIKAAFESKQIDWASDNHDIKAEQRYNHCVQKAEEFESKGGITFVPLIADDWNA